MGVNSKTVHEEIAFLAEFFCGFCMYGGHPLNHKFINHFDKRKQEAVACNNMSLARGFIQVVCSIRKYPVPILNKTQAETLLGVGPTHLIDFETLFSEPQSEFDDRGWREFMRVQIQEQCERVGGFPLLPQVGEPVAKKPKGQYTPTVGSATWAVVIVMHLEMAEMSLSEIVRKTCSFVTKYPKTSKVNETVLKKLMDALIIKKASVLNISNSIPIIKYILTDYGAELGNSLWQRSLRTENLSSMLVDFDRPRTKYELLMVVDSRELALLGVLNALGVSVETRALTIGDVIWVWRREKSDEYIAGFAIERKTMDDLSSSIKDGRYDEQRKRISKAPGIDKVVYLIEGSYEGGGYGGLPEASLNTAIRHTEMMAGFSVVRTESIEETALVLLKMHEQIASLKHCNEDDESVVTFREFNCETQKTKSLSISQQSAMMLRAIPGIGNEAILALNEYLKQINKGGITLSNVAEICGTDEDLNEKIKRAIGAKRLPFNQGALIMLQQQYQHRQNTV